MKRLLLLASLFASLALFAPPQRCAACSCALLPPTEKIAQSDAIFRGRVVAITTSGTTPGSNQRAVTFQVVTSWKGSVQRELTVALDQNWPGCGEWFMVGDDYLVFADGSSTDALTAQSCRGTRSLRNIGQDQYLQADLRALGAGTPVAGADESGSPPVPARAPRVGGGGGRALPIVALALAATLAGVGLLSRGRHRWRRQAPQRGDKDQNG